MVYNSLISEKNSCKLTNQSLTVKWKYIKCENENGSWVTEKIH